MLIDKPRCNFKNCRYCFDGNCISADKYENCQLTDLHCEIAKLTVDLDNAKSEWISVEERLPEITETVLIAYKEKWEWETEWIFDVDVGSLDITGREWNTYHDLYEGQELHITHWMPLPEPPKKGGGE